MDFLTRLERWERPLGWGALVSLAVGVYLGLVVAPPDAYQGEAARIMYVHVPSAWMAMLAFTVIFVASLAYLWKRNPVYDTLAHASAGIGAVFTAVALLDGAIWGKPIWGTWWTWDARLTSTAVLLLIYAAYLMLRHLVEDPERQARYAAVVGIVGFVDVPIIHMSVVWWRTLHQPASVLKPAAPSMAPAMLFPLVWMGFAFLLLYLYLLSLRTQLLRQEQALEARQREAFRDAQL